MTAAYIRFSTSHQEDVQQVQALREWAEPRGIIIDEVVKDEGVSGGVSYRDRNLYRLVRKLRAGDTLLVSELSRLGRAMGDISRLLNEELKPRKIRLVVIKSGIDVDCANMRAPDEFIFSALSFAAQVEKELIQARTQSAIDARKEAIERDGGFFSKSGRWCTKFGHQKGVDTSPAREASILSKAKSADDWRQSSDLYHLVERGIFRHESRQKILSDALKKYEEDPVRYGTRRGKPLCEGTLSRWAKEIELSV